MDQNPYQAPAADLQPVVGVLSGKREDVRAVAVYQKGVLVSILVCFLAMGGQGIMTAALAPPQYSPAALLFTVLYFVGAFAGLVFVFLLATRVYGIILGLLLGILTFLPCVGLVVLLVVNGKATSVLRQNGFRVGLLGARLADFDT
jgi:hypothetical protein